MTKNTPKDTQYLIGITSMSLILFFGIFAFFYSCGFTENNIRIIIRFTAQTAVILFFLAFVASSLSYFFNNTMTTYLLHNRALIGLWFGVFHTSHLLTLLLLQFNFHPVFEIAKISSLAAGGLAYLFMFIMMITSFSSIKKRLSLNLWKFIHTIGVYWIWIIFFNSYLKNVINKDRYHFFLALLVFGLIIRLLFLFIKNKNKLQFVANKSKPV